MQQLADATDQSSYVVKCDLTDENGDAVTPTSATWSLTDGNGEIINGRDSVVVSSLASTIYIALSGADINVIEDGLELDNMRCVTVAGTYNSSITGGLLPVRKSVKFLIKICRR